MEIQQPDDTTEIKKAAKQMGDIIGGWIGGLSPELTTDEFERLLIDTLKVPDTITGLSIEEMEEKVSQLSPLALDMASAVIRAVYDDEDAPDKIIEGGEYNRRIGLALILYFGQIIQIAAEEEQDRELIPGYRLTYGGNRSRPLYQINTRTTNPSVDGISGKATITRDGLEVTIENFNQLTVGWGAGVHKFLQYATMKLATQNHHKEPQITKIRPAIIFPLDEYIAATGAPLTKSNRQYQTNKIEGFLQTLYETSIDWGDPDQYRWERPLSCRIISSKGVKRGNVQVTFTPEFAHYVVNTNIFPMNQRLFLIDERNPAAQVLGYRLNEYYCMDRNKDIDPETGEVTGGQYNYVSVKTILDWLSEVIPSHEEVAENHWRKYKEKIIQPLHTAFKELEDKGVIRWQYQNAGRKPLTRRQQADVRAEKYDTIIDLYVEFELVDYDLTEKDIQRITEGKRTAQAHKEKQQSMLDKAQQKALDNQAKNQLKKKEGENAKV